MATHHGHPLVLVILVSYVVGVAAAALVLWNHFDFFEGYTGTHDDAVSFYVVGCAIVGMIAPAIVAPAFFVATWIRRPRA
jgi:NO-binding membrane sensor protein with MHYT domain